jgi:hypothetical protein
MLRRIFWVLVLLAVCTMALEAAVLADIGHAPGVADRNRPPVPISVPTIIGVSPDHGESGDVVTITGRGLGLDPTRVRVRIGGSPVEVTSLRETGDGYQQIEVELNAGTISGPVSVYTADQWMTYSGTFCAQPVIHDLIVAQVGDEMLVQISGSGFDPSAVAYVGDTPQEPQRLKSARRPHRVDPTLLFITVQSGDHGRVWMENPCPDGRTYTTTSTTTFWNSTRY